MKAVVWHGSHNVQIEDRPEPEPGPGQVQVRIQAVGICGSDMKLYEHGVLGTLKPGRPFIMGHEAAGQVTAAGPGVTAVKVGQMVCLNPQAACGACYYCLHGEQNLCERLDFKSVTGDGVFSEFVVVRADQAILLPEDLDPLAATTIEPTSVAVQALRQAECQAGIYPDSKILVFGAGAIGLLILAVLRERHVAHVMVVDVQEPALEKALQLGALAAVNPKRQDLLREIRRTLGERGPDVVFEAAGSSTTQAQALDLARPGGTVVMIGISPDETACVNVNRLVRSNLRVVGSVRTSGDTFRTAADLVTSGRLDMRSLISKVFPFAEAPEAFAFAADRKNSATKCLLSLL